MVIMTGHHLKAKNENLQFSSAHNGSSVTGWIILFGIIVVIAFVSSKRNNKK